MVPRLAIPGPRMPSVRCFGLWLAVALLGNLVASRVYATQYVAVVLDDSGSMAERMRSNRRVRKIEAAKEALLAVLQQLPESAVVGIVLLNGSRGDSHWILPLQPVQFAEAQRAIGQVGADGGTPLGEAIKVGADALLSARAQFHYGDFRLLLVTDGEATDPALVARYLPDVLARGLTVDVIGVDMPSDHSLATRVHRYRRADDPASLTRAVQEVFAETTGQAPDTGESDFALLEGIPTEWAAAALTALSEAGNEPIGEGGGDWDSPDDGAVRIPARRENRWSWVGSIFFLLLVLQAMAVARRATRRRRRRR